jgi:hypothetical protein
LVLSGLNSPRTSAGASGFRSNVLVGRPAAQPDHDHLIRLRRRRGGGARCNSPPEQTGGGQPDQARPADAEKLPATYTRHSTIREATADGPADAADADHLNCQLSLKKPEISTVSAPAPILSTA